MVEVRAVTLRFAAIGLSQVQAADMRVRAMMKAQGVIARRETTAVSKWMERNRTAILTLAAATASAAGALIALSPGISASMSMIGLSFRLLAMDVTDHLKPAFEGAEEAVRNLQRAFAALPESTQGIIAWSGFIVTGVLGVAAAWAGLEKLFAGSAIAAVAVRVFSAVGAAASAMAGVVMAALTAVAAALGISVGVLLAVVAVIVAATVGLYIAWQNNWLGIQDATAAAVDFLVGLWNGFLEVTAAVWGAIQSAITAVVQFVWAGLIQPFVADLQALWQTHGAALVAEARATWEFIMSKVMAVVEFLRPYVTTFLAVLQAAWTGFVGIVGPIWSAFWDAVRGAAVIALEVLKTAFLTAFDAIRTVVVTVLDAILTTVRVVLAVLRGDWEAAWTLIKDFVARTWDRIKDLADRIGRRLGELGAKAYEWGRDLLKGFLDGIQAMWTALKEKADAIGSVITNAIKSVIDSAWRWGNDLINNFIAGLQAGFAWLDQAVANIRNKLNIIRFDDPANDRMAARWGSDFVMHFARGVDQSAYRIERALAGFTPSLAAPSLPPGFALPAPSAAAGGTSIHITLEAGAVQVTGAETASFNEERLAERVASRVGDRFYGRSR